MMEGQYKFHFIKWGDAIPEWVIHQNNGEFLKRVQLAYHNWQMNVRIDRVLMQLGTLKIPQRAYDLSRVRVWCELNGYREGAD